MFLRHYNIDKMTEFCAITFHNFHYDTDIIYQPGSISNTDFEIFIQKYKDRIVSPEKWLEMYEGGSVDKKFFISLDDGLKSQYKIALPILKKYGVIAMWNINTGPLTGMYPFIEIYKYFQLQYGSNFYDHFFELVKGTGTDISVHDSEYKNYRSEMSFYTLNDRKFRYLRDNVISKNDFKQIITTMMDKKDVKVSDIQEKLWIDEKNIYEIRGLEHFISLHTHTHPTNLNSLSWDKQRLEIELCKKLLDNMLFLSINTIAYPCGLSNYLTHRIMKTLGIDYGFTDKPGKLDNRMVLPRIDINSFVSEAL